MKMLAVGDSYMPRRYFRQAFAALGPDHAVQYLQVDPGGLFTPSSPSELRIKEYQGSPAELSAHMAGVEVLVVQGAPVTDAVLDASGSLRLVGCARAGRVNVDVEAVSARRLPLVNTPGKNAEAVADQTLAFLVMLARGFPRAQRFLERGELLKDNWEGAKFIGSDLRRHTLGLVGYGQRVARRASPSGCIFSSLTRTSKLSLVRGSSAFGRSTSSWTEPTLSRSTPGRPIRTRTSSTKWPSPR